MDDLKKKARKTQRVIGLIIILIIPVIFNFSQSGAGEAKGYTTSFLFSIFSLASLFSALFIYPVYLRRTTKIGKAVTIYAFILLLALLSVIFFFLLASTIFSHLFIA